MKGVSPKSRTPWETQFKEQLQGQLQGENDGLIRIVLECIASQNLPVRGGTLRVMHPSNGSFTVKIFNPNAICLGKVIVNKHGNVSFEGTADGLTS